MGGNQSHDTSHEINLSDIVDCVIREENRFDLHASKRKHDIINTSKDYVDIIRPLKNIATDLVVDEFFQTKDTLYNFLQYVYTIFYDTLIIYREKRELEECDVLFLYKGGSILRIISREFLLELPESSMREISKFYSPYFKRSDADFSIYVNPELRNYEDVYHELGVLSYLVQNKIRYWFCNNTMKYFNFFRYNLQYQSDILKSYLSKMNKVEKFKNKFIDLKINRISAIGRRKCTYSNNADITLEFLNEEDWTAPTREVARSVIKNIDSIMTVTHNNALDFKGEAEDVRVKFNLARTKIIFTLLKKNGNTLNIGGELVDISIGHRDDKNILHFWKNMERNITTYDLNFSDECSFKFYSYSLSYLIHDLEHILFSVVSMPWNDNKYIKRLNRLFYLYFIDIFVTLEDGNSKFIVLKDVLESVFIPLKSSLRSWSKYISNFREKYEYDDLMIVGLMSRLEKLIPKLRLDKDMNSFTEMINVLINNAEIIIRSIMKIRTYCSTDGIVSEPDLYEADIKQLL